MGKRNITVIAKHVPNVDVMPTSIIWEDGRIFEIDSVMDIRTCASVKAGCLGVRYQVMIRGKLTFIFKDEDNWFMES